MSEALRKFEKMRRKRDPRVNEIKIYFTNLLVLYLSVRKNGSLASFVSRSLNTRGVYKEFE